MSTPGLVLRRTRAKRRRIAANDVVLIISAAILAVAVLIAVFGPLLVPHDPNAASLGQANQGSAPGHPLGFDSQGRDLLSRLLTGARTSMFGPFLVTIVAMLAGCSVALVAAWRGGWTDAASSTAIDILFAFPGIVLAILAAAMFGPGVLAPALALSVSYTPYVARVLRSAALRERTREYVAAAEVQGLSAFKICARHLIPNVGPLIIAQGTLLFGYAMVDFAAISYVGLGVQPPTSDWGVMVSTGQPGLLQGYPLESLSAGLCIVLVVVAVNLLGERFSPEEAAAG